MRTTIAILSLALVMAGCHSRRPIEQAPQAVQARNIETRTGSTAGGLRFSAVVMRKFHCRSGFLVTWWH
jgi:hypothetical protein